MNDLRKVPETSILVVLAFGLAAMVTGLRTFGQEQLIYLSREAQAGLPVVSWMLGHMAWDCVLQVSAHLCMHVTRRMPRLEAS